MDQINLFDGMQAKLKLRNKVRLIELFAGIGAQAKSLENLGVNFEHYRICEFDKYAVKSYNAVHGTNFEASDITKIHAEDLGIVDTDTWQYIMTYSFPCTDLSNAGKQAGMSKGSGTRSGLLWEVERLLTECLVLNGNLPQIMLMENVPQVHGVKNMQDFNSWISFLSSLGYTNVWKDLNAKDFGIPQNRNRCYMISFLGSFSYTFPSGKPLEYRLKDYLEGEVNEKYYLSDKAVQGLIRQLGKDHKPTFLEGDSISPTIDTRVGALTHYSPYIVEDKEISAKRIGNIYGPQRGTGYAGNVWDPNYISPALTTMQGGGRQPMIIALDEQNMYVHEDGTVGTLTTDGSSPKHNNRVLEIDDFGDIRIRKLTPCECNRLMGFGKVQADGTFDDSAYQSESQVCSSSQIYKQAGNSIVVDVLEAIFKEML